MITTLLEEIRDNFLSLNAQTFQNGFTPGILYQDGRVRTEKNGEYTYIGLSDTECNFFYLRYGDNAISFDSADDTTRITACNNYTVTAPIRIVEWVNSGDIDKMIEITTIDLVNMDLTAVAGFDDVKPITIVQAIINAEEVFKEETLLDPERVRLAKGITILAMDFNLVFINNPDSDPDCIDRALCVDQCT